MASNECFYDSNSEKVTKSESEARMTVEVFDISNF